MAVQLEVLQALVELVGLLVLVGECVLKERMQDFVANKVLTHINFVSISRLFLRDTHP